MPTTERRRRRVLDALADLETRAAAERLRAMGKQNLELLKNEALNFLADPARNLDANSTREPKPEYKAEKQSAVQLLRRIQVELDRR